MCQIASMKQRVLRNHNIIHTHAYILQTLKGNFGNKQQNNYKTSEFQLKLTKDPFLFSSDAPLINRRLS